MMRIGVFCKKYNISHATVRYYIDINLLSTSKKNSQYYFSDSDKQEMEIILRLKELDFSIHEIQQYLQVIRMYDPRDEKFHILQSELFRKKWMDMEKESLRIKNILDKLQMAVSPSHHHSDRQSDSTGIPLAFSPHLACPKCDALFHLQDLQIKDNKIYSGQLICTCGYHAFIEDGILLVPPNSNFYTSPQFNVMHYREQAGPQDFVLFQYMNDLASETTSLIYKSYNWIDEVLKSNRISGQIIFIPDLASHYLYKNLEAPYLKNAFIIVTGFSKQTILAIKSHIDVLAPKLNIIYIANTIYDLPIRKGLIDLWIDAMSSYNFSFFHDFSLQQKIKPYLACDANIIGFTKYYESSAKSLANIKKLYPYAIKGNSLLPAFLDIMKSCNYRIADFDKLGSTTNPGPYYEYHHIGEHHLYYGFHAVHQ